MATLKILTPEMLQDMRDGRAADAGMMGEMW